MPECEHVHLVKIETRQHKYYRCEDCKTLMRVEIRPITNEPASGVELNK